MILASIGNRDVLYKGQVLESPREDGERLLERYDEVKEDIELPIIEAGLEYVQTLSRRYPEVLGRNQDTPTVGLYCTDQDNPEYRPSDTVELARLIEKKLPELFPTRSENRGLQIRPGKKSILLFPIGENPARYDRMYSFFEDFFAGNQRVQNPEGWLCFVLATGGTPAISSMLLLHSIQHFGSNCVQVYVSRGEDRPQSLRVGQQIARAETQRRFNEALGTLQFRAAAAIAESAFDGGGGRTTTCRYAEHRLAFDFRRSREFFEKALREAQGWNLSKHLEQHADVVDRLDLGASDHAAQPLLIAELFYNLEVKYQSGEFVDVLGRTFRLQEALLTWIVERNTSIRTGTGKRLAKQKREVQDTPGLWEFLENYAITGEGSGLNLEREINNVALLAVAEYLQSPEAGFSGEEQTRTARVVEVAKSIDKLRNLRNHTIIAHGFSGVSEDELLDTYGSESLIDDLRTGIGTAIGKDLSTNPFVELAQQLRF